MAYQGPQVRIPGLVAGADLSAAQYHFVKFNANKSVILCAATTDKPIGVLQNDPKSGQEAVVCASGVTKVVGHVTLAFGNSIGTAEDGRADVYTAADTTKHIVGQVIEGATGAGSLVTAVVDCAAARLLA